MNPDPPCAGRTVRGPPRIWDCLEIVSDEYPIINGVGNFTTSLGGDTIVAVKIIVYTLTFAVILALAGAIAWLSLAVAPAAAKSNGWSVLAVILGGLAVAGGVVYLSEKLINTGKGGGQMVLEVITEKFKQHEREAGIKVGIKIGEERGLERGREEGRGLGREEGLAEGREERQRAWEGWSERREAAFRAGLPFDEPPPGYASDSPANDAGGG